MARHGCHWEGTTYMIVVTFQRNDSHGDDIQGAVEIVLTDWVAQRLETDGEMRKVDGGLGTVTVVYFMIPKLFPIPKG